MMVCILMPGQGQVEGTVTACPKPPQPAHLDCGGAEADVLAWPLLGGSFGLAASVFAISGVSTGNSCLLTSSTQRRYWDKSSPVSLPCHTGELAGLQVLKIKARALPSPPTSYHWLSQGLTGHPEVPRQAALRIDQGMWHADSQCMPELAY